MPAVTTNNIPPSSSSTTSASVFARLTGRRHPNQQQSQQQQYPSAKSTTANATDSNSRVEDALADDLGGIGGGRGKLTTAANNGHHRRESSLLSLTNSVTDLGSSVKRSVSLRSHRTTGSSSSSFARGVRSPSSNNILTSISATASPIETADESAAAQSSSHPSPPRSRGRPSLSVRTLTHKFKSTDALPKFSPPDQIPSSAIDSASPPSAYPLPKPGLSSMLVANQSAIPPGPTRPPPERPAPQAHTSSFPPRDVVSSHGGSTAPSLQRANTTPTISEGAAQNYSSVYQQIHETSAKRMATMDYLRRVHEGDIFYFGTLHYSQSSLSSMSSMQPHKLGRRATNYFILGYSLPATLDMNSGSPLEYLKALSALLQEFEAYQTLSGFDSSGSSLSRGRMGAMLKSGMNLGGRSGKTRRSSTTAESIGSDTRSANGESMGVLRSAGSDAMSPQEMASPIIPTGLEFNHLLTPHLPFEPDFSTTLATLCDTLIDTYGKLTDLVTGPETCGPGVGDAFAKADKSIRKILVSNVVREFEDTSRVGVKAEVAGLGKVVLGGLM